jgi:hypothetical protein
MVAAMTCILTLVGYVEDLEQRSYCKREAGIHSNGALATNKHSSISFPV